MPPADDTAQQSAASDQQNRCKIIVINCLNRLQCCTYFIIILFKGWQGADRPAARDLVASQKVKIMFELINGIEIETKVQLMEIINAVKKAS